MLSVKQEQEIRSATFNKTLKMRYIFGFIIGIIMAFLASSKGNEGAAFIAFIFTPAIFLFHLNITQSSLTQEKIKQNETAELAKKKKKEEVLKKQKEESERVKYEAKFQATREEHETLEKIRAKEETQQWIIELDKKIEKREKVKMLIHQLLAKDVS